MPEALIEKAPYLAAVVFVAGASAAGMWKIVTAFLSHLAGERAMRQQMSDQCHEVQKGANDAMTEVARQLQVSASETTGAITAIQNLTQRIEDLPERVRHAVNGRHT